MQDAQRVRVFCVLLAAITLALFAPVTRFAFLNCDDQTYVVNNQAIHEGVTGAGLIWALTTNYASNWHPLTWVSHMLDCDLYGPKPGGHHLTSVLLHAANSVLVFLVLRQLTGAMWRSACVAALFAWHPLHVESVAWVAERKDVLSAFFWLLTLAAYAKYVSETQVQARRSQVLRSYALALLCFSLGLLAKPMVVTLPFVLLLLDFWPLGRISNLKPGAANLKAWSRLLLEKLPFFVLAALDCVATVWAQKAASSIVSVADLPFSARIANAQVSYVRYLGKLFWPQHLSPFYPYPDAWRLATVVGSGAILLLISVAVVARIRRQPFLFVGWFWFLGTLVPVIGLAQVGIQAMADRYTYLPSLGIFIMGAWGFAAVVEKWPRIRPLLGSVGTALFIALALGTRLQLQYWRDSASLFSHALAVTRDNPYTEYNLGEALEKQGDHEQAIAHYTIAVGLQPNRAEALHDIRYAAYNNLGNLLVKLQKPQEAEPHLRAAVRAKPDLWQAHHNLAVLLAQEGRFAEAADEARAVVRLQPRSAAAWQHLGSLLEKIGQGDEAANAYQEAARLGPSVFRQ
jgi:protein O-mannosyl-transferase